MKTMKRSQSSLYESDKFLQSRRVESQACASWAIFNRISTVNKMDRIRPEFSRGGRGPVNSWALRDVICSTPLLTGDLLVDVLVLPARDACSTARSYIWHEPLRRFPSLSASW